MMSPLPNIVEESIELTGKNAQEIIEKAKEINQTTATMKLRVESITGKTLDQSVRYLFQTAEYSLEGNKIGDYQDSAVDKEWIIAFYKEVAEDTINDDNIYIVDEKGNRVEAELIKTGAKTITIKGKEDYESSKTYYLFITGVGTEEETLSKNVWMKFTVEGTTETLRETLGIEGTGNKLKIVVE